MSAEKHEEAVEFNDHLEAKSPGISSNGHGVGGGIWPKGRQKATEEYQH